MTEPAERRIKEDRRAHLLKECPQGPVILAQSEILHDLKNSNERVAIALEVLAKRGAQVDSHEKHLDTHDNQINTAFFQIRSIDARVMSLEMKRHVQMGKEEAIAEINEEKKVKSKFWDEAKIQLMVHWGPVLVFFACWILDKFGVFQWIAKMFREMHG